MPSHADTKKEKRAKLPHWATDNHVLGNTLADGFADKAAERASLLLGVVCSVLKKYSLVKRIQARIAAIVVSLPHRTKQPKTIKMRVKKPTWLDLLDTTDHEIRQEDDHIRCMICLQHAKSSDAKRILLATVCKGPSPVSSHSVVKVPSRARINRLVTHPSHALASYRGVLFCTVCGGLSTVHLKSLGNLCRGEATSHGRQCIRRIAEGKLPKDVDFWPQDLSLQDFQQSSDAAVPLLEQRTVAAQSSDCREGG